jgi:hypothetical protein
MGALDERMVFKTEASDRLNVRVTLRKAWLRTFARIRCDKSHISADATGLAS